MSLLALTISVGMIIDDTIVVLENSYRHMEEGKPRMQAAREGIAEIGFAVIATSLAIGAVFIPVAFMTGLVGRFFYEFGLTVAFAVAISTFIAVTLSPMLCSRDAGRHAPARARLSGLGVVLHGAGTQLPRHAWPSHCGIGFWCWWARLVVFVGGMALTPFLGKEFVPSADEDQFNVQVEAPVGTSIEATATVLDEIERRLRTLPGVTSTFATIGAGAEGRVNVGTILTKLKPKAERPLGQQDIMLLARNQLADLTHMKISVEDVPRVSGGGFRASPIQYNIRGTDLDQLLDVADTMETAMRETPGVVDVNSTYDAGKPEVNVLIDRDRAADLGVSVEELGKAVRTLIGGEEVTKFQEGGESYDVRVRLAEVDRDRPESILSLPVRTDRGSYVELRNLIRIEQKTGPVQIERQDRMRQVTIMANLEKDRTLGEALNDIRAKETALNLPATVTTAFTGAGDLMAESFASIGFSMALAAILIYMVLAAQFESLIHPFTVMLSLPLSHCRGARSAAGDRPHPEHLLDDRHDHVDGAGDQERHSAGRLHQPVALARDVQGRRAAGRRTGPAAPDPDDRLFHHCRHAPGGHRPGLGSRNTSPHGHRHRRRHDHVHRVDVDRRSRHVQRDGRHRRPAAPSGSGPAQVGFANSHRKGAAARTVPQRGW